ncbi:hypothetical protein QBC34DRAFT_464731 [Podospora aff. communis PSN243]|uniref:Ecp2 effector protein domain-containing protein n=1 Tax=Podospora aff. communis PSN243 TaxID=3040156 RepID=A0AAV9H5Q4_9PEZI|nr:hypothetical protein QBC34DRAFT_464731 [Podospora aff. communis PSN243]
MFLRNTTALVAILAFAAHLVAGTPLLARDEEGLGDLDINPSDVQITPGEGLPSLESLGITTADLHDNVLQQFNTTPDSTSTLSLLRPRALECINSGPFFRILAAYCTAYLEQLGNTPCVVTGAACTIMCVARSGADAAYVGGRYMPEGITTDTTQSYCRHVAHASRMVTDNCLINIVKSNRGREYAYGNGHFLVGVSGHDWPCRSNRGLGQENPGGP